MEPQQTPHGQVVFAFASELVAGKFDAAHALLSPSARREWPPALLESTYKQMVEYFENPPSLVMVVNTMEDWPSKQPKDIGWAYAAIASDSESEAVTVVVCEEAGGHLIRTIEWGRP
jgi:hypothetical protein